MARSIIPLRPKDFTSPLSQAEQSCLTWFVLSGCTRKEAFVTFARPDMLNSKAKAAIDEFVKQFFAGKEAQISSRRRRRRLQPSIRPLSRRRSPGH